MSFPTLPEPSLSKHGGRIGSMQSLYFNMCADFFTQLGPAWVEAQESLAQVSASDSNDDVSYDLHGKAQRTGEAAVALGIQVIVIAAMCLEAAIYDYAAWHLHDNYVKNHLDRLSLLSKWLVIPRLITQRELRVGRPAYEKLKRLIDARNALVHSKSAPMPWGEELHKIVEQGKAFDLQIINGARDALMAIILLSLEMDYRFGDLTINPLPRFSKDQVIISGYSPAVRALISECRGLFKKSQSKSPA